MTLYELLQKVEEENEKNLQNAKILADFKSQIEKYKKNQDDFINEQFENGEIDTTAYQIIMKRTNRVAYVTTENLEEVYAPRSRYSDMLSNLKDSGVFISNKMLCNLMKTRTGFKWDFKVVGNSKVAYLVFENALNSKFRAQGGYISAGKTFESVKKQLENINWFQQYLSAQRNGTNSVMEFSLITGQKGFLFPIQIQSTLDNFFQQIKIDPNHPENLTLDDHRFDEEKEFKPHNLYYRYQRDKKAGKLENLDGKNGK